MKDAHGESLIRFSTSKNESYTLSLTVNDTSRAMLFSSLLDGERGALDLNENCSQGVIGWTRKERRSSARGSFLS